jgi:hypothetical protein
MLRIDAVVWAWAGMVEMVGFRQVIWFIMLEYSNDRILGVDTQNNMWYHMSDMERLAY